MIQAQDCLRRFALLSILFCLGLVGACQTGWSPDNQEARRDEALILRGDASDAMKSFQRADPSMKRFFDESAGYAVFPNIGKGGIGIGGAHGNGVVYENDLVDGYSTMSQVTVGFQFGGQVYREVVFFRDATALDDFRRGNFELSAQASAVAAKEGSATAADYNNGVAIFYMPVEGAMFEASIGGQSFDFRKNY